MNITHQEQRQRMTVFDTGFWRRVSKSALLKDTAYTLGSPEQFIADFHEARQMLADSFGITVDRLAEIYAENEYDCDDMAEAIAANMKIISRKRSMASGEIKQARPVFPMALKEDHTINYEQTDIGPMFADGGSGEVWGMERKPNVIFIG